MSRARSRIEIRKDKLAWKHDGWTSVPNRVLRNNALSPSARWAFAWLVSHDDDFMITAADIAEAGGIGIHAAEDLVYELEAAGYLLREFTRNADGRISGVVYTLVHKPVSEKLRTVRPRKPRKVRSSFPKRSAEQGGDDPGGDADTAPPRRRRRDRPEPETEPDPQLELQPELPASPADPSPASSPPVDSGDRPGPRPVDEHQAATAPEDHDERHDDRHAHEADDQLPPSPSTSPYLPHHLRDDAAAAQQHDPSRQPAPRHDDRPLDDPDLDRPPGGAAPR